MTRKRIQNAGGTWSLQAIATYNTEGQLLTFNYPNSGKLYNYTYDVAGRPNGINHFESGIGTVHDVSGLAYNAAGQFTAMSYKHEGYNYADTYTYNNLYQTTGITALRNGAAFAGLQYGYPAANAGRIDTATNTISGEVVGYIYDELGRLTNANAQQWTQQYFYDGFGNLFKKTGTGLAQGWGFDYTPLLNSAKNQIGTHDPNGNPTNENLRHREPADASQPPDTGNSLLPVWLRH